MLLILFPLASVLSDILPESTISSLPIDLIHHEIFQVATVITLHGFTYSDKNQQNLPTMDRPPLIYYGDASLLVPAHCLTTQVHRHKNKNYAKMITSSMILTRLLKCTDLQNG